MTGHETWIVFQCQVKTEYSCVKREAKRELITRMKQHNGLQFCELDEL